MLVSYKVIGRNIRQARMQAGLTQEQTAEKLKISQLHFGRLERGERPASLEQLAHIAQVLHVPLASLLNGCAIEELYTAAPDEDAAMFCRAITHLATGCSAKARKLMLSLCQSVAESDRSTEE